MAKERNRTDYHREWRKKNPRKYALNQLNYWKRKLNKLDKEEAEAKEEVTQA